MPEYTASQELQLKTLRLAYRACKTDEARKRILQKAELVKNPLPPAESAELAKNAEESLMSLPDWNHPYWAGQRVK